MTHREPPPFGPKSVLRLHLHSRRGRTLERRCSVKKAPSVSIDLFSHLLMKALLRARWERGLVLGGGLSRRNSGHGERSGNGGGGPSGKLEGKKAAGLNSR